MNIDINTLAIVLSITHLLQVIALFVQWQLDKNHPGLGWWLLGIGTTALGFVALFLRSVPQLVSISIVGNNVLFVYGSTLLYIGILRFFNRRERRRLLIALLAAYTLIDIYLTFVDNDVVLRRTTLYLVSAALAFITARAVFLYKNRFAIATANFLAAVFFAHGIVLLVSMLLTLTNPSPSVIQAASPDQVVPILDGLIATSLWTFGFILMVNQRLSAESSEAREYIELIFNTSPDAVLVTRLNDGIVVEINDGFLMLTGYIRAEVIGKSTMRNKRWPLFLISVV
ncbi:MAG: PAS domain S-box protein [Syntrophales bacterium]